MSQRISPWKTGSKVTDNNFKCNFVNENYLLVSKKFSIEICSMGCARREVSVGSYNGVALNMQQSIM